MGKAAKEKSTYFHIQIADCFEKSTSFRCQICHGHVTSIIQKVSFKETSEVILINKAKWIPSKQGKVRRKYP